MAQIIALLGRDPRHQNPRLYFLICAHPTLRKSETFLTLLEPHKFIILLYYGGGTKQSVAQK